MENLSNSLSTYEKARNYEQKGEYLKALELFRSCLTEDTEIRADILFHAGYCCELGNKDDQNLALSFYQEAAEQAESPELKTNSLFRTGWLLMQRKEYVKAASFFKSTIDDAEAAHLKNETYEHATYWYAVCIETQGCYIDAIKWYRVVQKIAPKLGPESSLREIICLNHIGSFEEALKSCVKFGDSPPDGFDNKRYEELKAMVDKERDILEKSLSH